MREVFIFVIDKELSEEEGRRMPFFMKNTI